MSGGVVPHYEPWERAGGDLSGRQGQNTVTNNHMRLEKQMLEDGKLEKRVKQIHNKPVSVE